MTTDTTAYDVLRAYDFDTLQREIYSKTIADVQRALAAPHRTIVDFMALVSPAAVPLLEEMAREAHRLTVERFGHTIQLYIPLYLSNVRIQRREQDPTTPADALRDRP